MFPCQTYWGQCNAERQADVAAAAAALSKQDKKTMADCSGQISPISLIFFGTVEFPRQLEYLSIVSFYSEHRHPCPQVLEAVRRYYQGHIDGHSSRFELVQAVRRCRRHWWDWMGKLRQIYEANEKGSPWPFCNLIGILPIHATVMGSVSRSQVDGALRACGPSEGFHAHGMGCKKVLAMTRLLFAIVLFQYGLKFFVFFGYCCYLLFDIFVGYRCCTEM